MIINLSVLYQFASFIFLNNRISNHSFVWWEFHWCYAENDASLFHLIRKQKISSFMQSASKTRWTRLIKRTISNLFPLGIQSHQTFQSKKFLPAASAICNQITEERSISFLRITISYCRYVSVISPKICIRLLLWSSRLTSSMVPSSFTLDYVHPFWPIHRQSMLFI